MKDLIKIFFLIGLVVLGFWFLLEFVFPDSWRGNIEYYHDLDKLEELGPI